MDLPKRTCRFLLAALVPVGASTLVVPLGSLLGWATLEYRWLDRTTAVRSPTEIRRR